MRNISRNQNSDASSNKSFKTFDNNGSPPWSNLDQDPLFRIMMKLGVADFFSFRRVCKPWRSLALADVKKYLSSRQPLFVSFSTDTMNECYLHDFEGRKFKIILPQYSTGSTCIGLTCGYLIFFSSITRDFRLVNPVTRHELHFPSVPLEVSLYPTKFRCVLVFSPSVSRWAFVFSHRFFHEISFCLSGNQASRYHLISKKSICDIHFFKGKIYMVTTCSLIYEVRFDPSPTLSLLDMKNAPKEYLLGSQFVDSGKNLYVVMLNSADSNKIYEIDFEKMEWVLTEKTALEYAFFVGTLQKSSAAINPDKWADCPIEYETLKDTSKIKGMCFFTDMLYFPHNCLNVNTL